MLFKDRFDAAEQLAKRLNTYALHKDIVIVAIPRGGLQLGSVLARRLHSPLDVALVKKIGYPGNPEYAIGAVSLESITLAPEAANISQIYLDTEIKRLRSLLTKRMQQYHAKHAPTNLVGKTVIIVDDGAATGQTTAATIDLIKQSNPHKIILALPVASRDAITKLEPLVDELICLAIPEPFFGVGQFYAHFPQVEDSEAIQLFDEATP